MQVSIDIKINSPMTQKEQAQFCIYKPNSTQQLTIPIHFTSLKVKPLPYISKTKAPTTATGPALVSDFKPLTPRHTLPN